MDSPPKKKKKTCHHLLTLISFQTCMSFFCRIQAVLGKVTFEIMRYSIALLPKKVTNYENLSWACLFVFKIKSSIFCNCKKTFHTKKEMNKPQTEGNDNSPLYSSKCYKHKCYVYPKSFLLVDWIGSSKVSSKDIGLKNGIKSIKDICVI